MEGKTILWIFDLDDTLFFNAKALSYALVEFYEYLCNVAFPRRSIPFLGRLGEKAEEVWMQIGTASDGMTRKVHNIRSSDRYAAALVGTYQWLCGNMLVSPSGEHEQEIFAIGMRAASPETIARAGCPAGTHETLRALRGKGDILKILTRGSLDIQMRKLEVLGLAEFFDSARVFSQESKNRHVFFGLAGLHPECVAASVGNSYLTDIQPALEAGIFAVYLPGETWKGEDHDGSLLLPVDRLFVISDICELPGVRERMQKIISEV